MSGSHAEIVDDRDPRVEYSDGWLLTGVPNENDSTAHATFTPGSNATFRFEGLSVEVYGTISNISGSPFTNVPYSAYILDALPVQIFIPPLPGGTLYKQLFYRSPPLNNTQHVLFITSVGFLSVFYLDFFNITSNELPTSVKLASSTPTSSPLPESSPPTIGPPIISYPTTDPVLSSIFVDPSRSSATSALPSSHNLPMGAVVGGVTGGSALVLLVCFIVLYYRRREKSQKRPPAYKKHGRKKSSFLGDISPFTSHWFILNGNDVGGPGSGPLSKSENPTGRV